LTVVIAQRLRIEERAKNDPARGASHDGDDDIGEDAIATEPSADRASDVARIKMAPADHSASALFFLSLFQSETPFSGIAGVILKKKNCHFLSAVIPYTTDARADAAARNPQLRLMFRLAHFHLLQDDDDNGGA
jgi:hypothetical protein